MQSKDTTGTRITASLVRACRGREGVGKAGGSLERWEGRRMGGSLGGVGVRGEGEGVGVWEGDEVEG